MANYILISNRGNFIDAASEHPLFYHFVDSYLEDKSKNETPSPLLFQGAKRPNVESTPGDLPILRIKYFDDYDSKVFTIPSVVKDRAERSRINEEDLLREIDNEEGGEHVKASRSAGNLAVGSSSTGSAVNRMPSSKSMLSFNSLASLTSNGSPSPLYNSFGKDSDNYDSSRRRDIEGASPVSNPSLSSSMENASFVNKFATMGSATMSNYKPPLDLARKSKFAKPLTLRDDTKVKNFSLLISGTRLTH
jgi:hypothetical protein